MAINFIIKVKTTSKTPVIPKQTGVTGVVVLDNNEYKIRVLDINYKISDNSYDCKKRKYVFYNNNIIIRTDVQDRCSLPYPYLPFRDGLLVKGTIINNVFIIIKVYTIFDNGI